MKCPTCKKEIEDPATGAEAPKYFPFCSERCKLIDLGRWLGENYGIRSEEEDERPATLTDEEYSIP